MAQACRNRETRMHPPETTIDPSRGRAAAVQRIRGLLAAFAMLLAPLAQADDPAASLDADALRAKAIEVTDAQNRVMMRGATAADVDHLFALYTDDFTYVHAAYGGTYSREELRGNTLRLLARGAYDRTTPRYVLVASIPGNDAIAVEREETHQGVTARHLAVFEFRGDRVSRIIEYWR